MNTRPSFWSARRLRLWAMLWLVAGAIITLAITEACALWGGGNAGYNRPTSTDYFRRGLEQTKWERMRVLPDESAMNARPLPADARAEARRAELERHIGSGWMRNNKQGGVGAAVMAAGSGVRAGGAKAGAGSGVGGWGSEFGFAGGGTVDGAKGKPDGGVEGWEHVGVYRSLGTTVEVLSLGVLEFDRDRATVLALSVGWPFTSGRAHLWEIRNTWIASPEPEWKGAIDAPKLLFAKRRLMNPGVVVTGLLWTGFLGNTLFWAGSLFAAQLLIGGLRRRRRAKRSQCIRCAYPVAGLPLCPECGWSTRG